MDSTRGHLSIAPSFPPPAPTAHTPQPERYTIWLRGPRIQQHRETRCPQEDYWIWLRGNRVYTWRFFLPRPLTPPCFYQEDVYDYHALIDTSTILLYTKRCKRKTRIIVKCPLLFNEHYHYYSLLMCVISNLSNLTPSETNPFIH